MLLPCVVSDAAWGSKGGGGAVLLTQARQDLLVLGATELSRSSTTDLAALTDALAALSEGDGALTSATPPLRTPAVFYAGES